MDLRIEKTERGIKNAFIELRSRKPLEKITVKELCESARINKSTFYAHYKDIYDLSDAMEEEVVQSIANSIQHPEYLLEHPAEFARELLMAYVSQNSLTAILFSGSQANHFADSIERSIKQMIFEKYPEFERRYGNECDAQLLYPGKLPRLPEESERRYHDGDRCDRRDDGSDSIDV